jgi:hypothetical protein
MIAIASTTKRKGLNRRKPMARNPITLSTVNKTITPDTPSRPLNAHVSVLNLLRAVMSQSSRITKNSTIIIMMCTCNAKSRLQDII